MSKLIVMVLTILAGDITVSGQAQTSAVDPVFEVAAVRPSASASDRSLLEAVQGRLTLTNMALRRIILVAYGVQDYQLLGDPAWITSEHYNIRAKADGNPTVRQMEGPMLQALLAERLKVALHRETRQLSIYELTLAGSSPKLQRSKQDSCSPYSVDTPPTSGVNPSPLCGLRLTIKGLDRTLDGKGVTMAMLATNLSHTYTAALGRNVVDATSLNGTFDIHLNWVFEAPAAQSGNGSVPSAEPDGSSIFTALQDQLGLKLKAAKGPIEVFVIDHIEKLSPN